VAWVEQRGKRFVAVWRDQEGRRHKRPFATNDEASDFIRRCGGVRLDEHTRLVIESDEGLKAATRMKYLDVAPWYVFPTLGGRSLPVSSPKTSASQRVVPLPSSVAEEVSSPHRNVPSRARRTGVPHTGCQPAPGGVCPAHKGSMHKPFSLARGKVGQRYHAAASVQQRRQRRGSGLWLPSRSGVHRARRARSQRLPGWYAEEVERRADAAENASTTID
jgi:hypothetical protein